MNWAWNEEETGAGSIVTTHNQQYDENDLHNASSRSSGRWPIEIAYGQLQAIDQYRRKASKLGIHEK